MARISSDNIYNTVKQLCFIANTTLPKDEYFSLYNLYLNETNASAKAVLEQILQNAEIAYKTKRPLCQDTGFVTIFLEIGQNVSIVGENIGDVCNKAVADAYKEFFFRKSIVNDPVLERMNTKDNTPILIHTEIVTGDKINITLSVKGGGCENISAAKMLNPAQGIDGIEEFVIETIKNANSKPCPPIKVGIGIGSNFEGSAILSKKALIKSYSNDELYKNLEKKLLTKINELNIGAMGLGGKSTCFGVNILSQACHIASLPVSISISCHSSRHASAIISEENTYYNNEPYDFARLTDKKSDFQTFNVSETEKLRNLKAGMNIYLSGTIYTARDAAHKKLSEILENNGQLPFDIKNSIIFYAGPCPANENEIIGPVGPTTSARMDKYTPQLYELGLLATIGKGKRSPETEKAIKEKNGKYFTITGGVASLLKNCVKSAMLIAYPELGTEAVYKLEVENLPLKVNI